MCIFPVVSVNITFRNGSGYNSFSDFFIITQPFILYSFFCANDAIGTLVLRFENAAELEKAITTQSQWLKIVVR